MKLSAWLHQIAARLEELEKKQEAAKETPELVTKEEFERFQAHINDLEEDFQNVVHELQDNVERISNTSIDEIEEVIGWYNTTDISELQTIASDLDMLQYQSALGDLEDIKAQIQDVDLQQIASDVNSLYEAVRFLLAHQGIDVNDPGDLGRVVNELQPRV